MGGPGFACGWRGTGRRLTLPASPYEANEMSPLALRRAGLALAILAALLLVAAIVGMVREGRVYWDRGLLLPALVLVLASRAMLRFARYHERTSRVDAGDAPTSKQRTRRRKR